MAQQLLNTFDNAIHHYQQLVGSSEYCHYAQAQNGCQNELKPNGVQFLQYDQIFLVIAMYFKRSQVNFNIFEVKIVIFCHYVVFTV